MVCFWHRADIPLAPGEANLNPKRHVSARPHRHSGSPHRHISALFRDCLSQQWRVRYQKRQVKQITTDIILLDNLSSRHGSGSLRNAQVSAQKSRSFCRFDFGTEGRLFGALGEL
jgi:hypothetical protein